MQQIDIYFYINRNRRIFLTRIRNIMTEENKMEKVFTEVMEVDVLSKKYPLFKYRYDYLNNKYVNLDLNVKELCMEIKISSTTFNDRKKLGKRLPSYVQDEKNSTISFPIICVALFQAKNFVYIEN